MNKSAFIRVYVPPLFGVVVFFSVFQVQQLYAGGWEQVLNLKGKWRFTIGDDLDWADPDYPDEDWEQIWVPTPWENEGFHGYNGFGWYRKTFSGRDIPTQQSLYLVLGYIDDVDEVYLNGVRIGISGAFPPEFITAYRSRRCYPIPNQYLNPEGENVIAVRVYDSQLSGGIIAGDIGIYNNKEEIPMDLDLRGIWKFKVGDNAAWKQKNYNDHDWYDINVPVKWEDDGFRDYDGIAWYRLHFHLPKEIQRQEQLFLVLGRIDDFDQAYVNGQFVGSTNDGRSFGWSQSYRKIRVYRLEASVLQYESENTLAIRVEDMGGEGGIYEGSVGIIRLSSLEQLEDRN